MKKEPCIRLGMRIRPKISEKPEESRNSKPPSAMLFTAKVSHRLMQVDLVARHPTVDPEAIGAARTGTRASVLPATPRPAARDLARVERGWTTVA